MLGSSLLVWFPTGHGPCVWPRTSGPSPIHKAKGKQDHRPVNSVVDSLTTREHQIFKEVILPEWGQTMPRNCFLKSFTSKRKVSGKNQWRIKTDSLSFVQRSFLRDFLRNTN